MAEYMTTTGYGMTIEEAITFLNNCLDQNTNQVYVMNIHDEMLISNWNSVVSKDDIVWFLGDFAFSKYIGKERIKKIGHLLKGHKKMVYGNHDKESVGFYNNCGFEEVCTRPTLLKNKFLLSHAPLIPTSDSSFSLFFNIYGHVHSHEAFNTATENTRCVCVERTGFTPVEIEEYNNFEEEPFINSAAAVTVER